MQHAGVNSDEFLFTTQVAQILKVSAETVRAWERRGRLPAIRTAIGVRLFSREDVERLALEKGRALTVQPSNAEPPRVAS
jgi:excisionase family DNA binding protein